MHGIIRTLHLVLFLASSPRAQKNFVLIKYKRLARTTDTTLVFTNRLEERPDPAGVELEVKLGVGKAQRNQLRVSRRLPQVHFLVKLPHGRQHTLLIR